jgi:hypothetical protein
VQVVFSSLLVQAPVELSQFWHCGHLGLPVHVPLWHAYVWQTSLPVQVVFSAAFEQTLLLHVWHCPHLGLAVHAPLWQV